MEHGSKLEKIILRVPKDFTCPLRNFLRGFTSSPRASKIADFQGSGDITDLDISRLSWFRFYNESKMHEDKMTDSEKKFTES